MKRLLILLLFVPFIISAQGTYERTLGSNEWTYDHEGNAGDTLFTGDSIWYFEIWTPKHGDPLKYKIYMDIDSTGGTSSSANKYYIVLQAKNSEDETYSGLDSVAYIGTVDTTFSITETSTAQLYKKWRIYIYGLSDELKIEIQKLNWAFYK